MKNRGFQIWDLSLIWPGLICHTSRFYFHKEITLPVAQTQEHLSCSSQIQLNENLAVSKLTYETIPLSYLNTCLRKSSAASQESCLSTPFEKTPHPSFPLYLFLLRGCSVPLIWTQHSCSPTAKALLQNQILRVLLADDRVNPSLWREGSLPLWTGLGNAIFLRKENIKKRTLTQWLCHQQTEG